MGRKTNRKGAVHTVRQPENCNPDKWISPTLSKSKSLQSRLTKIIEAMGSRAEEGGGEFRQKLAIIDRGGPSNP